MQNSSFGVVKLVRKLNEFLVVIVFGSLALIVLAQVVARHLFHSPLSWSEEAARFLQIWMVMLGSAIVMRKGAHLAIDILTANLSFKVKRVLNIVINILVSGFLLLVVVYGSKLVALTSTQVSPAMQIPMSIPYFAFPLGGALMLIEALINLKKFIEQKEDTAKVEKKGDED